MNLAFALLIILSFGCSHASELALQTGPALNNVNDPHSYAEPQLVRTTHIDLNLEADFSSRTLAGWARLSIADGAETRVLRLDTTDLDIQKVTIGEGDQRREDEPAVVFQKGPREEVRGEALIVPINARTRTVTVYYRTSKTAGGLVWLEPKETSGGKAPFLFTQSEPILGRSWIPCQDTPSVRVSYTADIKVPPGLLALMSGTNPQQSNTEGSYHFDQKRTVPSYLISLAVGRLAFRSIGPRTGVYAEPEVVESAAREFEQLEEIVKAGESIFGPYQWARYDLLMMPSAFPYGGMENPELSYVMPGVITGTKSQVSMVTHELSHSWTGNVVTNATWNDMWLNEGWTTWAERLILEKIYGRDARDLADVFAYGNLENDLANQPPGFQKLQTDAKFDQSPDDVLSTIPYEKGYHFLRTVEKHVGSERMLEFAKTYINKFSFQTVSTEQFVRYLNNELIKGDRKLAAAINIDGWVQQPGLPPEFKFEDTSVVKKLRTLASDWLKDADRTPFPAGLNAGEVAALLRALPAKLPVSAIAKADQQLAITQNPDPDVQFEWLLKILKGQASAYYPQVDAFFKKSSRFKYLSRLAQEMRNCLPEGPAWLSKIVEAESARLFPSARSNLQKTAESAPSACAD